MPGLRQVWLEVIISDKTGKKVFHSGDLDTEGKLKDGAVLFAIVPLDKNGQPTYYPWAIEAFKSDTTIPPKGKSEHKFEIDLHENPAWPLTARVILHYRGFPQYLANKLLPDYSTLIPVLDMAIKEIEISNTGP